MSDTASETGPGTLGRVQALWRYPIKSFRGEQIDEADITAAGVAGDRGYAVRDRETGRVLSAKRWARLFECAARYPTGPDSAPEITMPDGTTIPAAEAAPALSAWLGREVDLVRAEPGTMSLFEIAIQTVDEIEAGVDQLAIDAGDYPCPPGSFFDAAPLHVMTTATLAALHALYPGGRFDVRRFRPNVVVDTGTATGCIEEGWVGRTLAIGGQARAPVLMSTIRCVMTTLPQEDLPRDPKILRTVARSTSGNAGIYAAVELRGRVRVGDSLRLI
jgi:uncharacterized protein YcbX